MRSSRQVYRGGGGRLSCGPFRTLTSAQKADFYLSVSLNTAQGLHIPSASVHTLNRHWRYACVYRLRLCFHPRRHPSHLAVCLCVPSASLFTPLSTSFSTPFTPGGTLVCTGCACTAPFRHRSLIRTVSWQLLPLALPPLLLLPKKRPVVLLKLVRQQLCLETWHGLSWLLHWCLAAGPSALLLLLLTCAE